nr:ribosome biogenesis GTPase Der [Campylobacter sp.]
MQKIILIGRPNVGKSSLFNRLARARIAITSEIAGTTRDTNKTEIFINDKKCLLIDSGGLDESNELFKVVKENSLKNAANADIIIFMVDGKMYPDDDDKRLFYDLQKLKKPIALVVNKVDSKKDELRFDEFISFGAKDMFGLSVSHNIGTDELCEWIYKLLPSSDVALNLTNDDEFDEFLDDYNDKGEFDPQVDYANKPIKVGIIGRVNVGKSSLLNALIGEQRSVVSQIDGTTIDPVNEITQKNGRVYEFIDTAGIRKRGKIEGIEKYALNRTQKMLENADIALLILDASVGINELDERIAGIAAKFELGVIIVLNKWDLCDRDYDEFCKDLRDRFKFLSYAPIISVSATGGKRVVKIFDMISEVYQNYTQKLQTSKLNDVLLEAQKLHPAPRDHGRAVKIYYSVQFGFAPPKIALIMNKPKSIHFSYLRYIQNQIRANFELSGTPIILIPKNKNKEEKDNE